MCFLLLVQKISDGEHFLLGGLVGPVSFTKVWKTERELIPVFVQNILNGAEYCPKARTAAQDSENHDSQTLRVEDLLRLPPGRVSIIGR